ncbi:MAG: hypothetical protein HY335_10710 [Deinococcus sp.]|nr:hypothetical protein [Deinococcus sp.]
MATAITTTENYTESKTKYPWKARFGDLLAAKISAVPEALYLYKRELGLKPHHIWLIAEILRRKWTEEWPTVDVARLAKEAGEREATIHGWKDDLIELGYLRVGRRYASTKRQLPGVWDFSGLLVRLEELSTRDRLALPNQVEIRPEPTEWVERPTQTRAEKSAKSSSRSQLKPATLRVAGKSGLRYAQPPATRSVVTNVNRTDITKPVNVPLDHVKFVENHREGEGTDFKKFPNDDGAGESLPKRTANGAGADHPTPKPAQEGHSRALEAALTDEMVSTLGDGRSRAFYAILARRVPSSLIYRALGEVKELAREHKIKKSKGALFTAKIKKLAKEQGIALGIRSG